MASHQGDFGFFARTQAHIKGFEDGIEPDGAAAPCRGATEGFATAAMWLPSDHRCRD